MFSPLGLVRQAQAGTVQIRENQLWVDGQSQPQLWGAELQYFRLRGGQGPNIPREKVIALWNKALDRMVEAKMNAISFYIPWDFHEYAEGKFDFNGTADDDGDGKADYPSRDVITFFKLVEQHGIKHIMVRPGPYINAEWGFLGFGAVPYWFHQKYPDSHARNSKGQRTTLYSYNDPDFLRRSRVWLETVYEQVLKSRIGPGKPISFLQVDNETNFMWQSIYNHDYGARSVLQYQNYLSDRYKTLAALNAKHATQWTDWAQVRPPVQPGRNVAEDQDWYRFQDYSMYVYLKGIRSIWTELGVKEGDVLFTLAESYNAAGNGVLPNYKWRNSRDVGMMTVNLYPKTYETADKPLLNLPFKADHDVMAADSASDAYLGRKEEWVLGPEIQGGWWRGTEVTDDARRQTYLTTMGHGLKALFIYYFNEGDNWQYDSLKKEILPYFNQIKAKPQYKDVNEDSLPDSFWRDLDELVANQFLVMSTRWIFRNGGTQPETLYFDAPLGPDAEPRAPFQLVKEIGEKIVAPHGEFLAKATALEDPVCVIKDSEAHAPSALKGVDSRVTQSDWNAGLIALLMHAGVNPHIHHWNLNPTSDLLDKTRCKLIIYQDTGFASHALTKTLTEAIDRGGHVVTFIGSGLASSIRSTRTESTCEPLPEQPMNVIGTYCKIGIGSLYQAKVPIYDVFNTDFYFKIHDASARRGVIEGILQKSGVIPQVKINGGGDRTVTFSRANPDRTEIWVTIKTSKHEGFTEFVQWNGAEEHTIYLATDTLSGKTEELSGFSLINRGFAVELGDSGSTAFYIRPKLKSNPSADEFATWALWQKQESVTRMAANISPVNTAPGVVIASPSRDNPNYYFHWTRDASLVMDSVVNLYARADGETREAHQKRLREFIALSRRQQNTPSAEGLGEPRYTVDGVADTIPWSRPQFDGPALRVLTLLHLVEVSPEVFKDEETIAVIRADLEFVLRVWRRPCFDLWEEHRGLHFYTQASQYSAMRGGAEFFRALGDVEFATQLSREAETASVELGKYWEAKKGYIGASRELQRKAGEHYKEDNLDTAVILAALHTSVGSGKWQPEILSFTGERLMATAEALEEMFAFEFDINHGKRTIAIGRFADDVYFGGNPWYMTTAAFAELYYRIAQGIVAEGGITVNDGNLVFLRRALGEEIAPGLRIGAGDPIGRRLLAKLRVKGDSFLEVVRENMGDRGALAEQFDRTSGVPVSARDLTWSYAGVLQALYQRGF